MAEQKVNLAKYFTPYQIAHIRDETKHCICRKSRRSGMTYANAMKHTRRRVRQCEAGLPPLDAWVSTEDLLTAKEYIRYVGRWSEVYKAVAGKVRCEESLMRLPDGSQIQSFMAEFPNSARIVAISSNPNALHGKGGDFIWDEAAHHEQARDLWREGAPITRWGGGRADIISNPAGEGTVFDELCEKARRELTLPAAERSWSYQEITILDAVAQGLVEKILGLNRRASEAEKQAFLAECRSECLTEDDWLQNYMCRSTQSASAFLGYDLLAACQSAGADMEWNDARPRMGQIYIGVDIGRSVDLTVAWADEKIGDVFWTRAVLVMEKTPFRIQRERIEDLCRRSRFSRMAVDAGGIGMQLAEDLTVVFGENRVDSVHLGTSVQEDMASRVKAQFEDRRCRIPTDPIVRDDLHQPRKVLLPGGGVRLEVPRTGIGHADRFWAKALATRAAQTGAECGPIREGSYSGIPCQAALIGAPASAGGFRW